MGCFSIRCALTGRQLYSGDECVLVPIINRPSYCADRILIYANDMFRPFLLPIVGNYDEYGGIEIIEQHVIANMNKRILDNALKDQIPKNWHMGEFKFINENEIRLQGRGQDAPQHKGRSVSHTIFSLAGWNYAVENGRKLFTDGGPSSKKAMELYHNNISPLVNKVKDIQNETEKAIATVEMYSELDNFYQPSENNKYTYHMKSIGRGMEYLDPTTLRTIRIIMEKEVVKDAVYDALDNLFFVDQFMSFVAGKPWLPIISMGPQCASEDDGEWLKLQKFIVKEKIAADKNHDTQCRKIWGD